MENNVDCHVLEMKNVIYKYGKENESNCILESANYQFCQGKMYALLGKSGIGKSTTLALLGALDFPQKGEVLYKGKNIHEIGYQKYRRDIVSIIFQDYNLLPYLSGYQNIEIAMKLAKGEKFEKEKVESYLKAVGIQNETADRNVRKLSGGEQQRIAIARALSMHSEIILADEPTGNLDSDTSKEIIDILYKMAHEQQKCVIAVTHTRELAQQADVVLKIENKQLVDVVQ